MGFIRGVLHNQTPMTTSTINGLELNAVESLIEQHCSDSSVNRLELTDAQRREFQSLIEQNCSDAYEALDTELLTTARQYAEALNSAGDDPTTENFFEELVEMVDIRCVVTGLND